METHPLLVGAPSTSSAAGDPAKEAAKEAATDDGGDRAPASKEERKKAALYSGPRAIDVDVSRGNHQRYYGYRKKVEEAGARGDARLKFLEDAWFRGRKCKDVGCNDGTFTMALAREFAPRFLVGVDADEGLVRAAQASVAQASRKHAEKWAGAALRAADASEAGVLSHGPLPYPHNLWFEREDAAGEAAGSTVAANDHSFDLVSAFSVTKWIHLNHGDAGLVRFFERVFESLKPGGRFVYEPQPWKSYTKRRTKNASEAVRENFDAMRIRPADFPDVLKRVGFASVDLLGTPDDEKLPKGFRRPIFLATKGPENGGGAKKRPRE